MKKTLGIILGVVLGAGFIFAQESTVEQSFRMNVDAAYYFPATRSLESGTFWENTNGAYSGAEGRITGWYQAKVNIPGGNVLTSGNNIKFNEGVEITPVSVMAKTKVTFTPIAFLNFSAGVDVGTGWDMGPFKGGMGVAASFVDGNAGYNALTPFENLYIEPWAEGLFQFDVAAVMPKEKQDFMHIVMMATYKVSYIDLSGIESGKPWIWQLSGPRFNGWKYDSVITVGYQLPSDIAKQTKLSLAGVQVEMDGYFKDVAPDYSSYKSDYMTIGISPTAVFQFNSKHSLAFQTRVKNRRSFATEDTTFTGVCNGTEWYFDRIALSYTWNF